MRLGGVRVRTARRVSPSHLDAVLAVDLLELAADVRGAVRGVVLDDHDLPIEFAGGVGVCVGVEGESE